MSKVTKTLGKVLRGNADANIRFGDLCTLLEHLGFAEILNLQPKSGKTKAYQVKQVRGVITSYGLAGAFSPEEPEDASDEETTGE